MTLTARIDALLRRLGVALTRDHRHAVREFHEAASADRSAKGGHTRAGNMNPEARSRAARDAAQARWGKPRKP